MKHRIARAVKIAAIALCWISLLSLTNAANAAAAPAVAQMEIVNGRLTNVRSGVLDSFDLRAGADIIIVSVGWVEVRNPTQ